MIAWFWWFYGVSLKRITLPLPNLLGGCNNLIKGISSSPHCEDGVGFFNFVRFYATWRVAVLFLVVVRLSLALPLPSPCFRFIWNPLLWFSPFFFSDLYVRTCYSVHLRILRNSFLLFWFFLWLLNLVLGHVILYIFLTFKLSGIFIKVFSFLFFQNYIKICNFTNLNFSPSFYFYHNKSISITTST